MEENHKYLFIGGPFDGERREVDIPQTPVRLAEPRERSAIELSPRMKEEMARLHVYRPVLLSDGDQDKRFAAITVYLHEGENQPVARLIQGYAGTEPGAHDMRDEEFNELLSGPLNHPMIQFKFSRLVLCLRDVVERLGQKGVDALRAHCAGREEQDRRMAEAE